MQSCNGAAKCYWRNKVALKLQFQFALFIFWHWRKKCVFWRSTIALTQQSSNGAATRQLRNKLVAQQTSKYVAKVEQSGNGGAQWQWRSKLTMAEQTSKFTLNTQLQFIFSTGFLERLERAPKRAYSRRLSLVTQSGGS